MKVNRSGSVYAPSSAPYAPMTRPISSALAILVAPNLSPSTRVFRACQ
jgi:hypothetical protein